MKYLQDIYADSHTGRFSKLNAFTIKLLLIAIIPVPLFFFLRTLLSQSVTFMDANAWSIATWILSIISFISGLTTVIIAVKGINHRLGNRLVFSISVLVSAFSLLLLSGLVFLPHMYILF